MEEEQRKIGDGLKLALQMETEGKEYYLNSIEECNSKLSKDLLFWLAGEEDKHKGKFRGIYESIVAQKGWPEIAVQQDAGLWLKTNFKEMVRTAKPVAECRTDITVMEKAMEMEDNTYSLYSQRAKIASSEAEKKFYEAVAGEERNHYLALVDYREYLLDPSSYFIKAERHSMDGG
jgi:rubrerythrin